MPANRRYWSPIAAAWLTLQSILGWPMSSTAAVEVPRIEPGLNSISTVPKQTKSRYGQFRVVYADVSDPRYAELNQIIRASGVFEAIATELTRSLKLPTDITIIFGECGTVNAFYNPQRQQIVMCNELMDHFGQIFQKSSQSDQELGEAIINTTLFVFFHELGHGLIDVLNLPTTGREEDAVDEFSTLLLLEAGEPGEQAVLTAAQWFLLESARSNQSELPYWGEHSLDMQRFYGIACLAYGKLPDKYGVLVSEGILPSSRAERCPREYTKKSDSWNNLLAPYLQN